MDPNQQQLLLTGGAKDSTYVDDVFNTQTFVSPSQSSDYKVTNNIDNAGEGGFLWYKQRNGSSYHLNWDTVRGSNKYIYTNAESGENTGELLKSFDSDGYTIKTGTTLVDPARENVLWNFRRAPGFFDIVQYSGDSAGSRDIAHNLGCVPGMIILKRTDSTSHWWVYHKNLGRATTDWAKVSQLDEVTPQVDSQTVLGATSHQNASTFRVGNGNSMNATGGSYIAYLFAGGGGATSRSVELNGSNELTLADSNDWNLGQTFTIEAWVKIDNINGYNCIIAQAVGSGNNWYMSVNNTSGTNGYMQFYDFDGGETINSANYSIKTGQWYHVAIVNNSGTAQWYINGMPSGNSGSLNVAGGTLGVSIGSQGGSYKFDGNISNLRLVKGTAVYTSAFRPPTAALTNITNTKLLCCNDSSVTGYTVAPGTISNNGATASTDSPFFDPESFLFGEEADQNIVQCGSYLGDSSRSPVIYLGWEPQWVIFKNKDASGNWSLFDSMRGIRTAPNGNEHYLYPNLDNQEYTAERISLTPTGFIVDTGAGTLINTTGEEYIYIAIRRPDPAVQKPPEVGTEVFAMDTGNGSTTIPAYDSGFPVDLGIDKYFNQTYEWWLSARLTQGNYVNTNSTSAQTNDGNYPFDSNVGYVKGTWANSSAQSWMWRRYAGLDVVCYEGINSGAPFSHGLKGVPEMIWIKNRSYSSGEPWTVGHFGMNGGSNPWHYWMPLNSTDQEQNNLGSFNDTAPTATHFYTGNDRRVSADGYSYIAILFRSVEGISKCGYYDGQVGDLTITTGFSPRFLIVRRTTGADNWWVFDTLRGWVVGNNSKLLQLDSTAGQSTQNFGEPLANGFTLLGDTTRINSAGNKYIYYAHA